MSTPQRTPGHAALRKGRRSLPGQAYLVTFATQRRVRLFEEPTVAMPVCAAVEDPRLWQGTSLHAWVLMPDHWHGLVALGPEASLSSVVQRLKANTARCLRARRPAMARTWAPGFHDRAVRREEALADVARYIIRNPVRAGLVVRVGDYPYWNAAWI